MPVFYFHLIEDGHRSQDVDGTVFASFELAFLDTYRAARDISWEMVQRGKDPRTCAFEIVDAAETSLAILPFAEALDPALNPIVRSGSIVPKPCPEVASAAARKAPAGEVRDVRRSAALPPRLRPHADSISFDLGEPLAE